MDHSPLEGLPQTVVDAVLGQLSLAQLATCSLVCTAWRELPYEYLPSKLVMQSGPVASGILDAGLQRCRRLRTICVSSSQDIIWPRLVAALTQQPLPTLRELHIQHSSQTDAAQLKQLQAVMQVQSPNCVLHLALTDRASLQALLQLLPLEGLVSLELNLPYLADGMLSLLSHAASMQAAALSSTATSTATTAVAAGQLPERAQRQCSTLHVSLWVCCWGGCPGLQLQDALKLQVQLHQVPGCSMVGCESVNIVQPEDLAALSQLQGLQALGLNFSKEADPQRNHLGDGGVGPAAAATLSTAAAAAATTPSPSPDWLCLLPLTSLRESLQRLNIRGSPPASWSSAPPLPHLHTQVPCEQQQEAQHQPAFAALTALTKLSLLKDWSQPALCIKQVAQLTLLQELAIERHRLQHPAELSCLSRLHHLKVLSLALTVTAEELLEASWEHDGHSTHAEQQQQSVEVAETLNALSLQPASTAAERGATQQDTTAPKCRLGRCCGCCCTAGGMLTPSAEKAAARPCPSSAGGGGGSSGCWPESTAAEVMCLQRRFGCCVALRSAQCPALMDWTWLAHLGHLEMAWLQVPHLDLSHLPPSLIELDAQQPRDLTGVSITCSRHSPTGIPVVDLPRLQRLVLPRLVQPGALGSGLQAYSSRECVADAPATVTCMCSHQEQCESHLDVSVCSCRDAGLQQGYEACLLLGIAQGCPEVRHVELVQWQPPHAVLLAAAQHLRFLRLLSVVIDQDDRDALHRQVCAVRADAHLGGVDLQVQEHLVLQSFPWSSVLACQ